MTRLLRFVLVLALIFGAGVLLWQALPWLAGQAPAAIRQRLPQRVLARPSTPLPTALPPPAATVHLTAVSLIPTLSPTPTTGVTAIPTHPSDKAPTITPSPTPSPTPMPPQAAIGGLAIVPQKFNNCGPTNLSILLNFYGLPDDQFDVAAVIRPTYDDRNVSPEELQAYVENETALSAALIRDGDLDLLRQLILAGFPVIIEKGLYPNEQEGWMGHYLTVTGYDDYAQTFTSLDTFLGPWDSSGRTDSYDSLDEFWSQFNRTLLVIYPPEAEAEIAGILGEERLDPARMWQHAAETAQTAVSHNPNNAFAWFNLGSSLTRLGQLTHEPAYLQTAVTAFDQARTLGLPWRMLWYQFELYEAYLANGRYEDVLLLTQAILESGGGQFVEETWLYRGHALRKMGDAARANAAYRKVLSLNPNGPAGREAASFLPTD